MGNTITLRRGITTPTAGSFVSGEPGWDAANSKLYIKNNAGAMICINPVANPADDTLVVHIAGTETITGLKTFSAAVVASTSVQSPQFNVGANSNNNIQSVNGGLNMQLYTGNTGYGVLINGAGGGRLGINSSSNPAGWLDIRDSDLTTTKFLVNANGRTLINTNTDDGSNQLQVSGSSRFTGAVQVRNASMSIGNSGDTAALNLENGVGDTRFSFSFTGVTGSLWSPFSSKTHMLLDRDTGNVTFPSELRQSPSNSIPIARSSIVVATSIRKSEIGDGTNWATTMQEKYSSGAQLAFFGGTPVSKPSGDIVAALSNLGLITSPTIPASSVTAAGSNTQIQFNNLGVLGASSNLTWSGTNLNVGGAVVMSSFTVNGGQSFLNAPVAGGQTELVYADGGTPKWSLYKSADNTFRIWSNAISNDHIRLDADRTTNLLGNVNCGNQLTFDTYSGMSRIVSAAAIMYQSNATTGSQHAFLNQIGTAKTAGTLVEIGTGTSGVGSGVDLLRFTGTSGQTLAKVTSSGSLQAASLVSDTNLQIGDTYKMHDGGNWWTLGYPMGGLKLTRTLGIHWSPYGTNLTATQTTDTSITSPIAGQVSVLTPTGFGNVFAGRLELSSGWDGTNAQLRVSSTSTASVARWQNSTYPSASSGLEVSLVSDMAYVWNYVGPTVIAAHNDTHITCASTLTRFAKTIVADSPTAFRAANTPSSVSSSDFGIWKEATNTFIVGDWGVGDKGLRIQTSTGVVDVHKLLKVRHPSSGAPASAIQLWDLTSGIGAGSSIEFWANEGSPQQLASMFTTATGYAAGTLTIGAGGNILFRNAAGAGYQSVIAGPGTFYGNNTPTVTVGTYNGAIGPYNYTMMRNTGTGHLEFEGNQSGYVGYKFKADGTDLVTINESSNVLTIHGDYRALKFAGPTAGDLYMGWTPGGSWGIQGGAGSSLIMNAGYYNTMVAGLGNVIQANWSVFRSFDSTKQVFIDPAETNSCLTVKDSALTDYGDIKCRNLTLTGGITSDPVNSYYVSRTLGATVNNFVNIGTVSHADSIGSVPVRIEIRETGSSMSGSHVYLYTPNYDGTGSAWRQVLPISSSGPRGGSYILEANCFANSCQLRVRRLTTGAGTAPMDITVNLIKGAVFTASTTTGTESSPSSTIASSAMLTQVGGSVVIGRSTVDGTGAPLQISGNVSIKDPSNSVYGLQFQTTNYNAMVIAATGSTDNQLQLSSTSGFTVFSHPGSGTSVLLARSASQWSLSDTAYGMNIVGTSGQMMFETGGLRQHTMTPGAIAIGHSGSNSVYSGRVNVSSSGVMQLQVGNGSGTWANGITLSYNSGKPTVTFNASGGYIDTPSAGMLRLFGGGSGVVLQDNSASIQLRSAGQEGLTVFHTGGANIQNPVSPTTTPTLQISSRGTQTATLLELHVAGSVSGTAMQVVNNSSATVFSVNKTGKTTIASTDVDPLIVDMQTGNSAMYIRSTAGSGNAYLGFQSGGTTKHLIGWQRSDDALVFYNAGAASLHASLSQAGAFKAKRLGVGLMDLGSLLDIQGTVATAYAAGGLGDASPTASVYNLDATVGSYAQLLFANRGSGAGYIRIVSECRGVNNSDLVISNQGTERFRLTSGGVFTLTGTAQFKSPDVPIGTGYTALGQLDARCTDAWAQDKGGTITLGGSYGSTTTNGGQTSFGAIHAKKANAGNNDLDGYMAFEVSNNTTSPYMAEAMRIDSQRRVLINRTTAVGSAKLQVTGDVLASGSIEGNQIWINGSQVLNEATYLTRLGLNIGGGYSVVKLGGVFQSNETLVGIGGIGSTFPALRRNGTVLEARLADDSAYTDIHFKTFTSSSTGHTLHTINSGTGGEGGFFFQTAGVNKWELYNVAGSGFSLYNYNTGAAAFTFDASSNLSIGGNLVVNGTTVTFTNNPALNCGVITSSSTSNNNMTLNSGASHEAGILFKGNNVTKYQLYCNNNDSSFRIYGAAATMDHFRVDANGGVLIQSPSTRDISIQAGGYLNLVTASGNWVTMCSSTTALFGARGSGYDGLMFNSSRLGFETAQTGVGDAYIGRFGTNEIGIYSERSGVGNTLGKLRSAQVKIQTSFNGYTPDLWVSSSNSTLGGSIFLEWTAGGTNQKIKAIDVDSNGLGFYRMADGGGSFVSGTPDLLIDHSGVMTAGVSMKTPTIKITTSPTVGYVWKCTNVDGSGSWQAESGGGGGVSDGDKGDITVSSSGTVWTIDNSAVTLAKLANIATATFLGRNTASSGVVEELSIATAKTMLGLTGTNSGDQTITLTGDVTGSGTGSFATTIASNAVTFAKMQNVATQVILGRDTGGTGNIEALAPSTVKTMLQLSGTNTGDQTITLTGDVTGSGTGSFAATIANNAVSLAKMATIATASFLGRNTASTGNVEVLSTSTVRTMLSISNVENTALSTWAGSANITTVGTIATGTWNATAIADGKIASALTGKTYNALTLTAQVTGFTIAGGTSSRTLTVAANADVSGTNTGDQTITLTGDVTGSGTSSFAATIANNAVTLAKFQQIATASFIGRNTASTGNIEVLSVSTVKTMLNLTGTNSGDQTITLTGDVTGSGTSSFSATIANNAVTLAKFQQIATASFLGRNTASTGNVEVLSVATAKTLLNLTGTNSGDQTITLTGDVTGSGTSSFSATIANSAVTNAKMANMAAYTIKGNNTGSSAAPTDLTRAQARAMLRQAKYTMTFASSQTWDLADGLYQEVTLTGNMTLGFPSNAAEGETVYIIMKQDGTGGRTLTLNSGFKTAGGAGITLSTGANDVDWLHIFFVSSTVAYVTVAKDFS